MATEGGTDRFSAEAAAWDSNPLIHILSGKAWETIQRYFPFYFPSPSSSSSTSSTTTFTTTPTRRPNVLEIGAGTGTLTLLMAPQCQRIVAVDAAKGMIDALSIKLQQPNAAKNVDAVYILLEDPEDKALPPAAASSSSPEEDSQGPRLKFDLITSHLVLHHIADIPAVLNTMFGCLTPGSGWVALTDFEDFGPQARKFHPESKMAGVERDGIKRDWIGKLMREAGFVDVKVEEGWRTGKIVERFPGEFGDRGEPSDKEMEEGMGEVMEFGFLICLGRRP